jgi:hypothetical protein
VTDVAGPGYLCVVGKRVAIPVLRLRSDGDSGGGGKEMVASDLFDAIWCPLKARAVAGMLGFAIDGRASWSRRVVPV